MNEIKVLDHGFVKLRNIAGPTRRRINPAGVEPLMRDFDASDVDVANSARMSFDSSDQSRTYEDEMKLNRYLMKNHHDTPYESIVVWLEYKLPIFVARQFVRHRTQTLNEVSGRYVTLPAEWYVPEKLGGKAANKKQGQEDNLSEEVNFFWKSNLDAVCKNSYAQYRMAIADGVAPEHARLFLHLNHYTHWLSTMNLRNLLHFLTLRDHAHAQIEAQLYAKAITQLLEPHIPGIMNIYKELMKQS